MKKNLVKKSIGLIVSMAMMAGLMVFSASVDAKATELVREPDLENDVFMDDSAQVRYYSDDIVVLNLGKLNDWTDSLLIYGCNYYEGDSIDVFTQHVVGEEFTTWLTESGWRMTSFTTVNKEQINTYRNYMDPLALFWVPYVAPTDSNASDASSPAHEHTWSWEVITEATETSDGLEGYVCSCGATRDTVKTPAAGVVMAKNQDKVTSAKDGETVVLELGMNHSLPRAFMEKIAEKRNTTFVIHSTYEHKNYEIVIPSGTPVVLDPKDEWFGILKQIEMFGMTEIQ